MILILLCSAPTLAAGAALDLYGLVDARLQLMKDVAAYKWHHGLAIEDQDREAVVLDRAVAEALQHGLTTTSSRRLFAAQIEAAKAIQRHWFDVWRDGAAPPDAPDLEHELRPELLRLGDAIVAAAADIREPLHAAAFADAVMVPGLDRQNRDALFDALDRLERYPHRLAQVLNSGVLRIGTTGDYAPFSYRRESDAVPTGIDIDLGRDLATALGVQARFVATSWPDLMADLAAGRFDIGMSGISRTLQRQRQAFLSPPYYVGGKTAIARCDRVADFDSLDAIDQPGVTVVVNPGGTNERFVDLHIHRAEKRLHADNRTIFDEIAAGRADVMITDRVEVELQAGRYARLCAAMDDNLTYQEKAYLLPQDPVWQAFVATWLDLALADGTVARVFRDHGVEPRPR
ncbi:MAG: gamma subclass chorismate mutase AroQ [Gammaproteobacteria bacterium]|nr:gamma subclass chorismate mutase AroQ [Gammaproteobacteria bacterium]